LLRALWIPSRLDHSWGSGGGRLFAARVLSSADSAAGSGVDPDRLRCARAVVVVLSALGCAGRRAPRRVDPGEPLELLCVAEAGRILGRELGDGAASAYMVSCGGGAVLSGLPGADDRADAHRAAVGQASPAGSGGGQLGVVRSHNATI